MDKTQENKTRSVEELLEEVKKHLDSINEKAKKDNFSHINRVNINCFSLHHGEIEDMHTKGRAAFEEIYRKYFPTIIGYLAGQNIPPASWEYVAEKALIHIWGNQRCSQVRLLNINDYVSDIVLEILLEEQKQLHNTATIENGHGRHGHYCTALGSSSKSITKPVNHFILNCLEHLNISTKAKVETVEIPIVFPFDEDKTSIQSLSGKGLPLKKPRENHDINPEIVLKRWFIDGGDESLEEALGNRENSLRNLSEKDRSGYFADELLASVSMVGKSKAILDTLKMIRLVAISHCNPILIIGEPSTGKELAAKAIHTLRHPNEQFVAVNCAALTANLLESELFGHVKGSFTGADREKTGLLELAGSGTLFLDEISGMPMDLQGKLLRVLQERTFRKVGGVKNIRCNATIIASSNRDLKKQVQTNPFRSDLYHRLNLFPIRSAPLRSPERKKDIPLLAEWFLKVSTICPEKTDKITSLTNLALAALQKHDWPGNVRELQNTIDRAILLEKTDKIGLSSIIINPAGCSYSSTGLTSEHVGDLSLAKAEREVITQALQQTNWQKTKAAELLRISRATLYAKVKQHNIERSSRIAVEDEKRTLIPS